MDVCHKLLEHFETEGLHFLHNIVTEDESWMHYYDPETKQQSSQWKGHRSPPVKAKTAKCWEGYDGQFLPSCRIHLPVHVSRENNRRF